MAENNETVLQTSDDAEKIRAAEWKASTAPVRSRF